MSTMSMTEAARMLKVHENRVAKLIHEGALPAAKVGRAWVLLERDVLAFVELQIAQQTAQRLGVPTTRRRRAMSRAA